MPIVFESPQPLDPGGSAAYGSAMQYQADFGRLLQAREAAAAYANQRGPGGGYGGGGGGGNPANLGAVQASIQARLANQQQQSADDQMAVQAGLQAQRVQNEFTLGRAQLDLQQQALTQPEKLRLNQLAAQRQWVVNEHQAGNLDHDTASSYLREINAGLDPLQQRAAFAKTRMVQLQAQQEMDQVARQQAIQGLNDQFQMGNYANLPMQVDPLTGQQVRLVPNPRTGELYDPFAKSRQKTSEGKGVESDPYKDAQHRMKEEQAFHRLYSDTEKEMTTKTDLGETKRPSHEEVMARVKSRKAAWDEFSGKAQQPSGGAAPRGPALSPAEMMPIKSPEAATPIQKLGLNAWDALQQRVNSIGLLPDQQRSYADHIQWAKTALMTYGNPAAMPDDVRDRYFKIRDAVGQLPSKPAPAPVERNRDAEAEIGLLPGNI